MFAADVAKRVLAQFLVHCGPHGHQRHHHHLLSHARGHVALLPRADQDRHLDISNLTRDHRVQLHVSDFLTNARGKSRGPEEVRLHDARYPRSRCHL